MRATGILAIGMAALVAWAAGCEKDTATKGMGIHLKPMPVGTEIPMFQVQAVRIQHRQAADAPVEDLWRMLGTAGIPYEKRALWEANDLRVGDGAELAAGRMTELLKQTSDRAVQVNLLQVRENGDFTVQLGGDRDLLDVLWTDGEGRLQGRQFQKCTAQFRIVCSNVSDDPAAIRVALVPEVVFGDETLHWSRTPAGTYTQRMERSSFVLSDFATEVKLQPGRLLILGGRPQSGIGLGGAFFHEPRGPDIWNQTLVLAFDRIKATPVTIGESMPFVPPPKAPATTGSGR
jgi:hypothetical protein